MDGAEYPLVSDFSLAFSHFSRVCDFLLSSSYFFLIVCYSALITQLSGLQSPSWFGFSMLYSFSLERYSLMWERLLFQSTTMSFITQVSPDIHIFILEEVNSEIWEVWVRLPWWLSWLRIRLQCGRPGFNPWVGKIPWRRERLATPVLWVKCSARFN